MLYLFVFFLSILHSHLPILVHHIFYLPFTFTHVVPSNICNTHLPPSTILLYMSSEKDKMSIQQWWFLVLSNHSRGLQLNLHKPCRNFFKSARRLLHIFLTPHIFTLSAFNIAISLFPTYFIRWQQQKIHHIASLMKSRNCARGIDVILFRRRIRLYIPIIFSLCQMIFLKNFPGYQQKYIKHTHT